MRHVVTTRRTRRKERLRQQQSARRSAANRGANLFAAIVLLAPAVVAFLATGSASWGAAAYGSLLAAWFLFRLSRAPTSRREDGA